MKSSCWCIIIICYFILSTECTERCCQRYRCDIDSPPGGKYTCEQQKELNQCNEHWMKGFCCKTCPDACPENKCHTPRTTEYLAVDKPTRNFIFNGKYIFLNGANQPWWQYGKDFGGKRGVDTVKNLELTLKNIQKSGGNVVRIWIFCEGKHYPIFDDKGNVIKSDPTNTLITDIKSYLDMAKKYDIFVIFTLWNAAVNFKGNGLNLKGMLTDNAGKKLQSFIDIVLKPLVTATKEHVALGAWEIINEPEGSLLPESSTTNKRCTDTIYLKGSGPSWTNVALSVTTFQQFINIQAAAIKAIDNKALVTVGAWSEKSSTDRFGYKNLWKDSCLIAAGGKKNGILDFYQIHTYRHEGRAYSRYAPLGDELKSAAFYYLDKPVIVGEFGIEHGGTLTEKKNRKKYAVKKYEEIYKRGFNGALMWAMVDKKRSGGSDGTAVCMAGMMTLGKRNDVDGVSKMESDGWFDWFFDRIWYIVGYVTTGLLLFGKTFMVLVGVCCCRLCCKKGRRDSDENMGDDEEEEEEDEVEGSRSWFESVDGKLLKWLIVSIWMFMGLVCVLVVMGVLVCIVIMLIEGQYGYQLEPTYSV